MIQKEIINNKMIQKEIIEDNINFFNESLDKKGYKFDNMEFFENFIIICL